MRGANKVQGNERPGRRCSVWQSGKAQHDQLLSSTNIGTTESHQNSFWGEYAFDDCFGLKGWLVFSESSTGQEKRPDFEVLVWDPWTQEEIRDNNTVMTLQGYGWEKMKSCTPATSNY